nr:unnamed protein product [Trichobilharzia regenti]
MLDIDQMGIETVIKQALQAVNPRLERPIHLSFDIDAMDPTIAPSTGTAVPGGLTLREGLRICEEISATGKLSVVEMAELNPLLGSPEDVEKTQQTAVHILRACLGHCRSGHLPFKVNSLAEEAYISKIDFLQTFNKIDKSKKELFRKTELILNVSRTNSPTSHSNNYNNHKQVSNYTNYQQENKPNNPKRYLGSLVTNLFDEQNYVLKRKFNINNLVLFPFETNNPYTDDRILAQMSYVPVQVVEARKSGRVKRKRIQYYDRTGVSIPNLSICPVNECDIVYGASDMQKADLVVFESGHSYFASPKPANQTWILYHLESPANFDFEGFKDKINFTATYSMDSTLVTPYYKYISYKDVERKDFNNSTQLIKDYSIGKTKMVAWFVSNCVSNSPRLEYAKTLKKYIQVDIYGACGTLVCERRNEECFKLLKNDYKFYLSFENSICQDYITEKLFLNGLKNTIVPIVMGASKAEYMRSAPSNSFIHVDDFSSAKQLADYLHYLDKNTTAYNEYFQWLKYGTLDFNTFTDCRLCMLAHEVENLKDGHWYTNMGEWRNNQCRNRVQPNI